MDVIHTYFSWLRMDRSARRQKLGAQSREYHVRPLFAILLLPVATIHFTRNFARPPPPTHNLLNPKHHYTRRELGINTCSNSSSKYTRQSYSHTHTTDPPPCHPSPQRPPSSARQTLCTHAHNLQHLQPTSLAKHHGFNYDGHLHCSVAVVQAPN